MLGNAVVLLNRKNIKNGTIANEDKGRTVEPISSFDRRGARAMPPFMVK